MTRSPTETAGQRMVAAFEADLAERGLTLDPREIVHLEQAAAVLDRLEEVRCRIRRTGLLITNETSGAVKANPLLSTERMLTGDLVRLLARIQLDVPDAADERTPAELYRSATRGNGPRRRARMTRSQGGA